MAHQALDLRSLLKCLMETFTHFNSWGKREKEFAVGLLPKAVCTGVVHHMTPSRLLFWGLGNVKDTRCILMFGTSVI